jgi:hypothetical protein
MKITALWDTVPTFQRSLLPPPPGRLLWPVSTRLLHGTASQKAAIFKRLAMVCVLRVVTMPLHLNKVPRRQHGRERATYLILVFVRLGVGGTVLANLLLAVVARAEEIVWFEALQADSAASCATRGLTGLRLPANIQNGDHLSDPCLTL